MATDVLLSIGQVAGTAVLTSLLTVGAQLYVERYKHEHVLERDRMNEQLSREREQWGALLPRVIALKDTAGFLLNHLCGWGITPSDEEYEQRFHELDTFAEKFAEYPEMRRAIWDLLNTTGKMLRWQGLYTAPGETQRMRRKSVENTVTPDERERVTTVELPERHRALLAVADALLATKSPEAKVAPASTVWWRRFLGRRKKYLTISDTNDSSRKTC